ncbi:MAG: hypothetical protein AAF959_08215 [Cyanobacteria bacterium P01_D01_bin.56]
MPTIGWLQPLDIEPDLALKPATASKINIGFEPPLKIQRLDSCLWPPHAKKEMDRSASLIAKLPVEPLYVRMEESAINININKTQQEVMQFVAQAVELGISIWAKSL